MNSRERLQIILILAVFTLVGLTINQAFTLLTPVPESPEMARAKAQIAVIEAEANIQNQSLYRSFAVGAGLVVSGIVLTFGSLALAFSVIRAVSRSLTGADTRNPYALEVRKHDTK